MSNRELLELAAKAAVLPVEFEDEDGPMDLNGWWPCGRTEDGHVDEWWNPLEDDGDALRLAVKLDIHVRFYGATIVCETMEGVYLADEVDATGDRTYATRRAIVRAAAEIGKTANPPTPSR